MDERNKFPSHSLTTQFVKYIDSNEIQATVETLAHSISEKYKGQELVLIAVLKGSNTFMADLVRKLKGVKVYVDFVKIKALGRDQESQGTMTMVKDISTNLLDRNVLIVEEIVDTGRALNFLMQRLSLSSPRSISIVTLFDKPYKRVINVKPEFSGKKIEDQFVVGYGLDLEDYGRNFEDLYYLKYPN